MKNVQKTLVPENIFSTPQELFKLKDKKIDFLEPIIKWAGGKDNELKYIFPQLPEYIENYFEPFVGGGALYTSIIADKYFINDKSKELVDLYLVLKTKDNNDFFSLIEELIKDWKYIETIVSEYDLYFLDMYKNYSNDLISTEELVIHITNFIASRREDFIRMFAGPFNVSIDNFLEEIERNLTSKIIRMNKIEKEKTSLPNSDILDNIEAALKSAFYMYIRHLYNNKSGYNTIYKTALFIFIRNYAYSGMFRYNKDGAFNVPYGGIGYNRKDLGKKINYYKSSLLRDHLNNTLIENLDFEEFLGKHVPQTNDFIFLDPPYDSEFSSYQGMEFGKNDHNRLADYLINHCDARWLMIIKNTEFIFNLYNNKGLTIESFEKKYLVSFMNRNNKDVEHLLIKNY